MNKFRNWTLVLLAQIFAAAVAADISISSESLSVADDDVTTYVGDVTVVVPAGTTLKIEATTRRAVAATEVLEGSVRFAVGTLAITTKRAVVTRLANGDVEIKMELANSREVGN